MSELQLKQVEYELLPSGLYVPHSEEPQAIRGQHVPDQVEHEDLHKRFVEGNDTYQVTTDARGMTHETILFNADMASKALILKPSTSFSSAYKNPANVLDVALAATLNPGAAYLYWGSDGNYPTGHMLHKDRAYRYRTARYTVGDGSEATPYRVLDSYRYFAEMLEEQDRAPTHLSADQEAGRAAVAIMAALSPGTVRGAYLNGIDGISPSASYVKAPFVEDMKSRVYRRSIGDGKVGELTPVNIKELKRAMPAIYSGLGKIAHLAPLPVFLFPLDVRDKIGLTLGFRGHKDLTDLADHAVFQDMSAALRQQEAMITMQFNEGSQQHDLEDCGAFSQAVMNNIPEELRSENRGVRMLLGTGNWTESTDKPYEAVRTQRLGLPDIKHDMRALTAAGVSDAQVFALRSIMRAA